MTETFRTMNIVGCGLTKEAAALEFVNELIRQFPEDRGLYDLMLRKTIEYSTQKDPGSEKINHMFIMKGSWGLVAKLDGK